TVAAGCVWAHKEVCLEFNQSWEKLGAITDALVACKVERSSFSTTFDDDKLLAFYKQALLLLVDDVGSLTSMSIAISAFDTKETGRARSCFAGWVASIACLAILRFYRDTNTMPTVRTELASVKATLLPKLTNQPWDMSTVENLQMSAPMISGVCAIHEPGSQRAMLSSLSWLSDWIDGPETHTQDICWSDNNPGSDISQAQYDSNRRGRPFSDFWDKGLEAISNDHLLGIMCQSIIPQEMRAVALIGAGLATFGFWSIDPYLTMGTAEFLGTTLCTMLRGWACDYDMEGLPGGNMLALWCAKTRDSICEVVMDRHRPWIDSDQSWRTHMAVNLYFVSGVRHFSTVRRTMGYPVPVSSGPSGVDLVRFVEILVAIGLGEHDVVGAGPVTIERPCDGCFNPALMTELYALTTGIPSVCSGLGERGLRAAATSDLLGLNLFPAMREYIGAGCECGGKVLASCFVDAFVCCGMSTPSKVLKVNATMKERWTLSLEQWVQAKAAESGYPVHDHTGR
ncbi:hypothetical protein BGX24_006054, partial [Mortierella sp. AD032]